MFEIKSLAYIYVPVIVVDIPMFYIPVIILMNQLDQGLDKSALILCNLNAELLSGFHSFFFSIYRNHMSYPCHFHAAHHTYDNENMP